MIEDQNNVDGPSCEYVVNIGIYVYKKDKHVHVAEAIKTSYRKF